MNILEQADNIVNKRGEEKERQYGPFNESLQRAADMFNLMSKEVNLKSEDIYKVLIALKLSREAYGHKEDNLLDAVAYIGALNNYHAANNKPEELLPQTVEEQERASMRASRQDKYPKTPQEIDEMLSEGIGESSPVTLTIPQGLSANTLEQLKNKFNC